MAPDMTIEVKGLHEHEILVHQGLGGRQACVLQSLSSKWFIASRLTC